MRSVSPLISFNRSIDRFVYHLIDWLLRLLTYWMCPRLIDWLMHCKWCEFFPFPPRFSHIPYATPLFFSRSTCDRVVLLPLRDQGYHVTDAFEFCAKCQCKHENRNSVTIKVTTFERREERNLRVPSRIDQLDSPWPMLAVAPKQHVLKYKKTTTRKWIT